MGEGTTLSCFWLILGACHPLLAMGDQPTCRQSTGQGMSRLDSSQLLLCVPP